MNKGPGRSPGSCAARRAMSAWFAWVMSAPAKTDRAAGRIVEPQHRAADRGLAAAGFADEARAFSPAMTWIVTSSTAFPTRGRGGSTGIRHQLLLR